MIIQMQLIIRLVFVGGVEEDFSNAVFVIGLTNITVCLGEISNYFMICSLVAFTLMISDPRTV